MLLKDGKNFKIGLNKDDVPEDLTPGEYTDLLNSRIASSSSQHGSGRIETLQGEIEVLINPDSAQIYYGEAIGGQFVYSGFAEITIGSQIWMRKNYDVNYPGSKVQDDLEANAPIYGRLYTWDQAMAADFVPPGYRVPTEADIDTLLAYLGGEMLAGGVMKEVGNSHWLPPNIGAVDSFGFRALPGGKFDDVFALLGQKGLFWIAEEYDIPEADPLLDKDGNEYTSLIVGTQEWILENLKTTHYADGTAIPNPGGYDDWFLPSKDEMQEIHTNVHAYGLGNFKTSIKYFTSSEYDSDYVWVFDFYGGGTFYHDMNGQKWITGNIIRPIRTFTTNIIYNLRDQGPAFGYIFHIDDIGGGYYKYYEVCSTELGPFGLITWSNVIHTLVGTSTDFGTGQANTLAIINQSGHTDSAANSCNDANGDIIWGKTNAEGLHCWYNDNILNKSDYGAVYNLYAVGSSHNLAYLERGGVQEVGWKIPSEADWDVLIARLGGLTIAGGKLKEIGTTHWNTPNTGATNESGFKALGAGYRDDQGVFHGIHLNTGFWSSEGTGYVLNYSDEELSPAVYYSVAGFSVRLVRDIADIPPVMLDQYVIFTDGISIWRKGVRDESFVLDRTLTPNGFAGTEDIDWENIRVFFCLSNTTYLYDDTYLFDDLNLM